MKKLRAIKITKADVKNVINKVPFTAFFGVKFVKANGQLRTMNCNRNISKGLKYQKQPAPITKSATIVFDVNVKNEDGTRGSYRYINLDTITEIRTNGKLYRVV